MMKSDFGAKTGNAEFVKTSNPGQQAFVEAVSPSMRAVEMVIHELAQSDVPVLLLGRLVPANAHLPGVSTKTPTKTLRTSEYLNVRV